MSRFRQIVFAASLSGLIAGAFLALAHALGTVPIILKAETYEAAGEASTIGAAEGTATSAMPAPHHEPNAWEPANGFERNAYTLLADVLAGIGFSLLLTSAYALRGRAVGWRQGLAWGLAGFAVFVLAPALGLPPEIPGAKAAPLLDRQLWWLGTVLATSGGLVLIILIRRSAWIVAGLLLVALPHLIGAPHSGEHGGLAPDELAHRFVLVALVTGLLFWLALGALSGFLYKHFVTGQSGSVPPDADAYSRSPRKA